MTRTSSLLTLTFGLALLSSPAHPDAWLPAALSSPEPSADTSDLRPFTANYHTKIRYGLISLDIQGQRALHQLADGSWDISFRVKANLGAATEQGRFRMEEGYILPLEYRLESSGLIQEQNRSLRFSHADKIIYDQANNRLFEDAWIDGIQDNLTYILQASLDLQQGLTHMSYPVFDRHRVRVQNFRVHGEEIINSRLGSLHTIKVQQEREQDDREILAWFSPQHQYQLIRLTERRKGKVRYQIDLTSIDFHDQD